MIIDNPAGTDEGGPLSLSEGIAAFLQHQNDEAPGEGQAEPEEEEQGEAEAEGEEPEAEADADEEQDEGEEQAEAPSYAPDDAKIRLDDGRELTLAEFKAEYASGALRQQDYTRKTQDLASERKAFEAKASEIAALEQQAEQDRQFMIDWLQASMPPKPDPSMLRVDPLGFQEATIAHQTAMERLQHVQTAQQEAQQRRSAEEAQTMRERQQREWEATVEAIPDLKDPIKVKSFVADVQTHGAAYGFTPQELANALSGDHRQAKVMRDAIAYRKLQESKPKVQGKVENRPPVQRGGNRLTPEASRAKDIRAAKDRLTKSGSIKDAVAFALELEKG